jgi:methylated-DNA-[protein]-cysteine S-methyltransferase
MAAPQIARYGSTDSPVGPLWVASSDVGVAMASFGIDEVVFCHELEIAGYDPEYDPVGVEPVVVELEEFFRGERTSFDLAVDLDRLPPFQREVLRAVAEVPYGMVRSYRDIAEAVGCPRAARAVGTAVAGNPVTFFIPCHRIVRSDGTLGEYGVRMWGRRGAEYKRTLLGREGVHL